MPLLPLPHIGSQHVWPSSIEYLFKCKAFLLFWITSFFWGVWTTFLMVVYHSSCLVHKWYSINVLIGWFELLQTRKQLAESQVAPRWILRRGLMDLFCWKASAFLLCVKTVKPPICPVWVRADKATVRLGCWGQCAGIQMWDRWKKKYLQIEG